MRSAIKSAEILPEIKEIFNIKEREHHHHPEKIPDDPRFLPMIMIHTVIEEDLTLAITIEAEEEDLLLQREEEEEISTVDVEGTVVVEALVAAVGDIIINIIRGKMREREETRNVGIILPLGLPRAAVLTD